MLNYGLECQIYMNSSDEKHKLNYYSYTLFEKDKEKLILLLTGKYC